MELDAAVRLADDYLDAERAVVDAVFSGSDADVEARTAALTALTLPTPGLPVGGALPGRRPGQRAAQLAASAGNARFYVRRRLFAVTRHRSPLWGGLCAAYAGSDAQATAGDYARRLLLADTDDGPRVIAEQYADALSDEVEWHELTGVAVGQLGPVEQARLLAEPEHPRDREHWRRLGAS